ncbi:MAG: putative Fe-S cluster assembly protein SufT [Verrucomicrobia bacterium]|nr:putative Fe-S cluster assembly protein SufT [Verrucomicrobiota bacterium]
MSTSSLKTVVLTRNVEAAVVPVGTKVTLEAGATAQVTQALGGSYTVVVNGNMFRVEGKDADALGLEAARPAAAPSSGPISREALEQRVWAELRTCFDPEIPVNIVDLGLIYDCQVHPQGDGSTYRVDIKMTLTAPGCGMGPVIQQDAQSKVLALAGVAEVQVELVWDPPWNQSMMSEAARLELGML